MAIGAQSTATRTSIGDRIESFGVREDAPAIHELLRKLSVALNRPHDVKSTPDDIARYGFGPNPTFETILARRGGKAVGLVLYFYEFSTWRGCPGVYIQDLYVDDDAARQRVGPQAARVRRSARGGASRRATCGCRSMSATTKGWVSTSV